MLGDRSPGDPFNDPDSTDIKLSVTEKDGVCVSLNVHRQILVANSGFFAGRLSERWTRQQRASGMAFEVEISDCGDVEVYVETLRLMYCKDLKRVLIKEDVPKVLGILKVWKRHLNKKEISKKEGDIIKIEPNSNAMAGHKTKLKVSNSLVPSSHHFPFDVCTFGKSYMYMGHGVLVFS